MRIAYVNGRYLPKRHAEVSIDDRGYQFGDGVYEVVTVIDGIIAEEEWHIDRLEYSLGEVEIPMPMPRAALKIIIRNIIRMNRLKSGLVYFQVTRGVAPRNHAFQSDIQPQLVMTATPITFNSDNIKPISVITVPDLRWQRCDIKTTQLLPNCMAKTLAIKAGASEAWMVDGDGFITEGSSTNAWIVNKSGEIITRLPRHDILNGITRQAVLAVAEKNDLKVIERAFTLDEALEGREAFMTSATWVVTSIIKINKSKIGDGKAGPVATALRQACFERFTQPHSG